MQNQGLVTIRQVLSPAGLLDQLGRQLAGLRLVYLVPNDLAAEDVHDQIQVPPGASCWTGQPRNVPAPQAVRRRGLVRGRRSLALWGLLSAPVVLLVIFMKHSVHRRLRGQVAALVRLIGHDEGRRAAPILWGVAQRHDRLSLFGRQLVGRLRAVGVGAAIRRHPALSDPAIVGPHIDAHHLTGLGQPSTVTLGVLHQGHDALAIREAGQSSSSLVVPQIASAFFDRASSAAVSARALSLRCSSRSSLRSRFCSALRA